MSPTNIATPASSVQLTIDDPERTACMPTAGEDSDDELDEEEEVFELFVLIVPLMSVEYETSGRQ